jgi:hypothetical protein
MKAALFLLISQKRTLKGRLAGTHSVKFHRKTNILQRFRQSKKMMKVIREVDPRAKKDAFIVKKFIW